MLKRTLISFFVFSALFISSCGNHIFDEFEDLFNCSDLECILDGIISKTGWLVDKEDLDNIPQDVDINGDTTGLPKLKLLEDKFPRIGDQGQYGTCVAWATGYNLKTALNAIDKNWSNADLNKPINQTSPKDLWFTLKSSDRGKNCGGTDFESALDALISKGANNLSAVPYSNMGNCSGNSSGDASNRLANYRMIAYNNSLAGGSAIEGMTKNNFKGYLAQGRPIVFGAKLGDRFMRWDNASVINTDTYNNPGMQHAYHAMVLVGYDDTKGTNGAFRVRNSWGDDWGDNGSIWVDYDFFLKSFCFTAFVAQNPPTSSSISAKQLSSGYDLQIAYVKDSVPDKNSPDERIFSYDVRNSGTKPILASQKWTVLYMYYNAFNARENGIIYEDYYTENPPAIRYKMPPITGKYYLVVYVDAYNAIEESDEDNNFYFIAANNGNPLEFMNGIMQNEPVFSTSAKSVQELGGNPNAYTPAEIRSLVLRNSKIARE